MITSTSTRIELPFIDTTTRKDIKRKECYLMLYDTYLTYKVVADYSTKNSDTEMWELVKSNYRWTRKKSAIADVSMYYDNPEDKWLVCIDFHGISDSMCFAFDLGKEAQSIYNQLAEYHIS